MICAVMQPYIFPYIGYFQLIQVADCFVLYDDVNFIKQGWINRNRILINEESSIFTIPLENSSSFVKINEIKIKYIPDWRKKTITKFQLAYAKAPYYSAVYPILQDFLNVEHKNISEMAYNAILLVYDYLRLPMKIIKSSQLNLNSQLNRSERLIEICKVNSCNEYINMAGGTELYNKEEFQSNGLKLSFLIPVIDEYVQFGKSFIPGLSIIDVMMFNSREKTIKMINENKKY